MTTCDGKKEHFGMILKMGICAQNIDTILGSVVNTIHKVFESFWFHEKIDSYLNLSLVTLASQLQFLALK